MKISDLRSKKAVSGDVGIELEVEGLEPLPIEACSGWRAVKENSLRFHGMEYVTEGAIPIGKARLKFNQLLTKLNNYQLNRGSPRTSLHVHYNVTDDTPLQVLNKITAFWMVDNVLARMCGNSREGNVFCLRIKDAEAAIDCLVSSLDYTPPFMCLTHHVKYASLNVWAIPTYGSLEVRLKGDCLNIDEGVEWITEIHTLFENAKKFENPEALMDYYLANGADAFLYKMFSTSFESKIKSSVYNWRELIAENALLVCDLAYAKSWSQWMTTVEEKMATKRSRPKKNHPYIDDFDLPLGTPISVSTAPGYVNYQGSTITVQYED